MTVTRILLQAPDRAAPALFILFKWHREHEFFPISRFHLIGKNFDRTAAVLRLRVPLQMFLPLQA
ncbi:hypothetical protein [Pseudochelatococcus contaminans]|uniref:Uncharacterized protein n=1 Tax=Pseudochelatococcus contaminans TaxID=1538103 RepID=A0A7W6EGU2_9HYPH|nr:hypothetical protein [Pseudochelatococcus contaminans]MBB3809658.1 hypothetical protein [Pseudochelatococcus contaminans]